MGRPPINPALSALVERAAPFFAESKIVKEPDAHLVFVCGGRMCATPNSARQRFLIYLTEHPCNLRTFLAEDAAQDLVSNRQPKFLNLAKFESNIAAIADNIVLFVESPGSIAELGFFAASPATIQKLLVIFDTQHQTHESFINNGLVDLINRDSEFRPAIFTDLAGNACDFPGIINRITHRFPKARVRYVHGTFNSLSRQDRLFLTYQVCWLMQRTTMAELTNVLRILTQDSKYVRLEVELSLLISSGYIERDGDGTTLQVARKHKPFMSVEGDGFEKLRIAFVEYYRKHDTARLSELERIR